MGTRKVYDSLGELEVPEGVYYGAQTARSLIHFNIGHDKMPASLINAYGILKRVCAEANCELGLLEPRMKEAIVWAANEVAIGSCMDHFPLSIWQTGSGTQTHMNVNEVIAYRAEQLSGLKIHPNDHVNMSQSTNDSFPTAMAISAVRDLESRLLPMVKKLTEALHRKAIEFHGIIKIGRTHLMDAVPLTLEQEFSGYVEQLVQNSERMEQTLPRLKELAIGGTVVGTGLNAPPGFVDRVLKKLNVLTGFVFTAAPNTFAAIAAHDPLVFAHASLKTLAVSLMKISFDLTLLSSGPRAGLGELTFPANEQGSSIMPGKVNPTQCEAMRMVCVHIFGHDAAIGIAGALGNLELNIFKPLLIHHFLQSVELLSDACRTFTDYFVVGLEANKSVISEHVKRSLMLVTVLNTRIGYDKAAEIAKKAHKEDTTLKDACLALGYLSADEFDEIVDPRKMV